MRNPAYHLDAGTRGPARARRQPRAEWTTGQAEAWQEAMEDAARIAAEAVARGANVASAILLAKAAGPHRAA